MTSLREILTADVVAAIVERSVARLAVELGPDVLTALERAHERESHPRGRIALDHLIVNAAVAQKEQVPLCQDTGSVWVLLEVGFEDSKGEAIVVPSDVFARVDAAVARAYRKTRLRKSMVRDALFDRSNTGDNTPAFTEMVFNPALKGVCLHIMLKGGGSDNASRVVMLTPNAGLEGVKRTVMEAVREKGSSACPPLVIGVGVGSSFDHVAALAKRALLRPLGEAHADPAVAHFERELLAEINETGIGPGGFGGETTALAVQLMIAPCHIASLPVAVNIGCNSLRRCTIDMENIDPALYCGDRR